MFWIIATILLGTIAIVSLIYNAIKDSKIDALEYEVAYGEQSDNEITIDNEHMFIVYRYDGQFKEAYELEEMKKGLENFSDGKYKVLIVDNAFDVIIK